MEEPDPFEYSNDVVYRIKQHLKLIENALNLCFSDNRRKLRVKSPKMYSRCWYGHKNEERFNYVWYSYEVEHFNDAQIKNIKSFLYSRVKNGISNDSDKQTNYLDMLTKGIKSFETITESGNQYFEPGTAHLEKVIDSLRTIVSKKSDELIELGQELHYWLLNLYTSYPISGLLPHDLWSNWVNSSNNEKSPRIFYVQLMTDRDKPLPGFSYWSDIENLTGEQKNQSLLKVATTHSDGYGSDNDLQLSNFFQEYLLPLFRVEGFEADKIRSVANSIDDSNIIGFFYVPIYLTTGIFQGGNDIGDWLGLLIEYDVVVSENNKGKNKIELAKEIRSSRHRIISHKELIDSIDLLLTEKLSDIAKDLFVGNGYQVSVKNPKGFLNETRSLNEAIRNAIGWEHKSADNTEDYRLIRKPIVWDGTLKTPLTIQPLWNWPNNRTRKKLSTLFLAPVLNFDSANFVYSKARSSNNEQLQKFCKRFYFWTRILADQISGVIEAQSVSLDNLQNEHMDDLTHELKGVLPLISSSTPKEALDDLREYLDWMLINNFRGTIPPALIEVDSMHELIEICIITAGKIFAAIKLATVVCKDKDDYGKKQNRILSEPFKMIEIGKETDLITPKAFQYRFREQDKPAMTIFSKAIVATIRNHLKHNDKCKQGKLTISYDLETRCLKFQSVYEGHEKNNRTDKDNLYRKETGTPAVIFHCAKRYGRNDIRLEDIFHVDFSGLKYTFFIPIPNLMLKKFLKETIIVCQKKH